jgi:hypothetical protein
LTISVSDSDKDSHCSEAIDADLKQALFIGLDESFTSLEESFCDLSDAQVWDFPTPNENNIAWIVMHCLDNLDDCANDRPTGRRVMIYEWRWDLWECKPEERPRPGDPFPTRDEMLDLLHRIRTAAYAALEKLDELALTRLSISHPTKHSLADFYLRTIYHTQTHIRQIWLLRGALGLANGPWPEQHWA